MERGLEEAEMALSRGVKRVSDANQMYVGTIWMGEWYVSLPNDSLG